MIVIKTHINFKEKVCDVTMTHEKIADFEQIQLEIFDTCTLNPKSVLGFGKSPFKINENTYKVVFDISNLSSGIYEIKLIRLHSPIDLLKSVEHIDFVGGIEFNRLFLNITENNSKFIDQEELSKTIIDFENELELNFNKGIKITQEENFKTYSIFVLIKGLKIGIRYRIQNCEFIPLNFGLQSIDQLNATNIFLQKFTKTNFLFEYNSDVDQNSQIQYPITVAHFPKIICKNLDEARLFAENRVNVFIESMSLIRGATGEIFDFIIVDLKDGKGTRLTQSTSYAGNLLTGGLSGESPESLKQFIESLEKNDFLRFLVSLHKETLNEKNTDYKFLRYWSILEVLAESKNYPLCKRITPLEDFDGNPLFEKLNEEFVIDENTNQKKFIKVKNSICIVYNLFKEHGFGNPYDNLNKVKIWIALRDSVAHFGSIQRYNQLSNLEAKLFAKKAVEMINGTVGHNHILWELKEDVKLLLMIELNKNAL